MRIGVFVGASVADLMTLDGLLARIKQAEDDGFDSFWIPHISARGYDALTTLALAGMQTSRIELGVGVVPTYPRHPAALAQQALTTATATQRTLHPRHRPVAPTGHGGRLRHPLRPPGPAHPRVPVGDAPAAGRWRRPVQRRVLQRQPGAGCLERPACPIFVSAWRPRCSTLPASSPTAP